MENTQKRNSYRIDRNLPIKFMKENRQDIEDGETTNISETGLAFSHDYVLRRDDIVKITIELEDKKITATGSVIANERLPEGSRYKFKYRIKFIQIQPNTQDILAKYIWNEQLKANKNEQS